MFLSNNLNESHAFRGEMDITLIRDNHRATSDGVSPFNRLYAMSTPSQIIGRHSNKMMKAGGARMSGGPLTLHGAHASTLGSMIVRQARRLTQSLSLSKERMISTNRRVPGSILMSSLAVLGATGGHMLWRRKIAEKHMETSTSEKDQKIFEHKEILPHHHIISSSVAGMTGIIIGFPLDSVRVRLQTQKAHRLLYHSMVDCITKTARQEGVLALYRGVSVPLMAQAAHKTAVWYSNAKIQHMLGINSVLSQTAKTNSNTKRATIYSGKEKDGLLESLRHSGGVAWQSVQSVIQSKSMSQWALYISVGAATGMLGSLVMTPVENVKVKLQVQGTINRNNFSGPLHVVRHTIRHEGMKKLYRGLPGVAIRDGFYYIAYLPTYEITRSLMQVIVPDPAEKSLIDFTTPESSSRNLNFSNLNGMAHFLRCGIAGGVAGMASWVVATPMECIKNRYMAHGASKYKSLAGCAMRTFKEGGFRMLFAGLKPSVLRAFPVHCTFWLTYELVKESFTPSS